MGDSIDNVPGVAGIGPKTAAELINKFGSLDALLAARAAAVKGKRGDAIVEAREAVRVSRELVRAARGRAAAEDARRAAPDRARQAAAARAVPRAGVLAPGRPAVGVGRGGDRAARRGHARARRHGRPRGGRAGARRRRRVAAITKRAALAALAAEIRAAGAVGAGGALRRPVGGARPTWSGSPSPSGERRAYLPLRHRYLGAPACLPEAEALAVLAPLLAVARRRQARPRRQDAGGAAAAARADAGGRRVGPDARGVPARRLAHALRPRRRQPAPRGSAATAGRAQLDGDAARRRRPGVGHLRRGGGRAPRAPRRPRRWRWPRAQPAKLAAAGLDGALPRHGAAARARAGARSSAAASSSTSTSCASSATRSARSLAALETEIHALAGGPFNINSPKQLADVLFGKLSLPVDPQDQDRPVDRRRHAGGAGRAAPGAGQDRRVPRARPS